MARYIAPVWQGRRFWARVCRVNVPRTLLHQFERGSPEPNITIEWHAARIPAPDPRRRSVATTQEETPRLRATSRRSSSEQVRSPARGEKALMKVILALLWSVVT